MRIRTLALIAIVALAGLAVVVVVVDPFADEPALKPNYPPVSAADGVSAGLRPDQADVIVIGDSVTAQSAPAIVTAMADRAVSVVGLSGYRTDELVPTATDAFAGDIRPKVGVVMAGYNDLLQGTEQQAPIDEMIDLMADLECAVWVLIPTKGSWERGRAQELEQRIRDAAEDAGVQVDTGWRDAVDAGDGPKPDAGLVSPDLVHPTVAGQQKVAEVMAAAVDRACG